MTQVHNIAEVLSSLRGVSFIGLDQETVVPLKGGKSNPMKDLITKRTVGSTVLVAQNKNTNTYQNMVRNAIVGELLREAMAKAEQAQSLLTDVLPMTELDELALKIEQALEAGETDRRAAAEERFEVKPRKWGERITETPFIKHVVKGDVHPNYYLDTIFLRAGKSEFFYKGQPITEDKIQGFERPVLREGAHIQGGLKVEDQIIVRTLNLASILAIRTGGQNYAGQFFYA